MLYIKIISVFTFDSVRSNYCVKEISSLTENLCGKTQYFGDVYVNSLCEFKKCADSCSEETISFEFEGNSYSRQRYCCKSDYCNSAALSKVSTWMIATVIFSLVFYLIIWFKKQLETKNSQTLPISSNIELLMNIRRLSYAWWDCSTDI